MDLSPEHAQTLASEFVSAAFASDAAEHADPVDALNVVSPGNGGALLQLIASAIATGYAAGQAAQAPSDDRLTLLVRALRGIHQKEIYGDCVEDGDVFPCKTVRAMNIIAGPAADESDGTVATPGP
ncbi:hypothetical protein [Microbacterium gorillae]|uniref:hypothetical protein n=1 Tax=Microbacterium gorillae TaxID=1231063 RepID=UPI003D999D21